MAPHSSTLAWKIPWMEEPSKLQSMGSLGVRHDRATFLSLFTFMHWRRKWQPTPVFLPRESQGWGSLVGCRLWGRTESDMTEVTQQQDSFGKTFNWRFNKLFYYRLQRTELYIISELALVPAKDLTTQDLTIFRLFFFIGLLLNSGHFTTHCFSL